MYCSTCNTTSNVGSYCTLCGEKLIVETFPCRYCRTLNYVNDVFCKECGKDIGDIAESVIEERVRMEREKLNKDEGIGDDIEQ